MTYPALTDEQRTALEAFAQGNGQNWREKLGDLWRTGGDSPVLRQVRNTFGPTWLHDVYAYGWQPECPAWCAKTSEERGESVAETDGAACWSAHAFPPPAVGDRVRVAVNGIGWAVVTGYFVEAGYLGVIALCEAPPERFLKQWGGNAPIHAFGAEIKLS